MSANRAPDTADSLYTARVPYDAAFDHALPELLGAVPDPEFDHLVQLATSVAQTPIAAISFLHAGENQIKASVGLDFTANPQSGSFCLRTVQNAALLLLDEDLLASGFAAHPLVEGPAHVKFYCGIPILSPHGIAIGALGVADSKRRRLSDSGIEALKRLAQLASQILERRQAALDLQRQVRLLNRAAKDARVGGWQLDVLTGELTLTQSAYALLELSPAEQPLTKHWFRQYVTETDFRAINQAAGSIRSPAEPVILETRAHTAKGRERWFMHTLTQEVLDGQPVRVAGVFLDITEQRELESDRRVFEAHASESNKLEALGVLASGIAHEFNNLLPVIKGYVEFARQDSADNPKVLKSLEVCIRACSNAQELTQQILSFAHRTPPAPRLTAVPAVVAEVCQLLNTTLLDGLVLRYSAAEPVPLVLMAPAQIQQVVLNLGINAAHAMLDTTGKIHVHVDAVEISSKHDLGAKDLKPGRYVRITVKDSGRGMSETVQAHLFEPFFTTKPPGHGSGLGLATVKRIVLAHGGAIRVFSKAGHGAKFEVYLPAAANHDTLAADNSQEKQMSKAAGRGTRPQFTVVYLDDQRWLLPLADRLLSEGGYHCRGYLDPHAVLELLKNNTERVDLIVTDQNMSGMTGVAFTRLVKALRPDLPVVMISGHLPDELREAATAAGVNAFIFKPSFSTDLVKVVQSLLPASGPLRPPRARGERMPRPRK